MYMPKRGGQMKKYKHKCVYFVLYEKDKKLFWHTPVYPLDMINLVYKMNKKNKIYL